MMDDLILTRQDLRAVRNGAKAGYCLAGLRRWAATHNLDFKKLLAEGVLASDIAHIQDPFKDRIIEAAKARTARENA